MQRGGADYFPQGSYSSNSSLNTAGPAPPTSAGPSPQLAPGHNPYAPAYYQDVSASSSLGGKLVLDDTLLPHWALLVPLPSLEKYPPPSHPLLTLPCAAPFVIGLAHRRESTLAAARPFPYARPSPGEQQHQQLLPPPSAHNLGLPPPSLAPPSSEFTKRKNWSQHIIDEIQVRPSRGGLEWSGRLGSC